MWFLYNILIRFLFFLIRLASLWRQDAKKWVKGRNFLFEDLQSKLLLIDPHKDGFIWFHVASLGEFEQGRPLIELIKKNKPNQKILISFFSPSGYEIRKDFELVDIICYFPSDLPSEINKFIDMINPSQVIFVKYEFWWNCLRYLTKKNIPYYFISVHLSPENYLRKRFFSTFRNKLKNSSGLFIQTEENFDFFKSHGFQNIHLTGDTRLDRVINIANSEYILPEIINFKGKANLLVLGSAWEPELKIIQNSLTSDILDHWKIIIAPHLVDKNTINQISNLFSDKSSTYSDIQSDRSILIIDRIGILNKIYRYADLAFIGGGFGKGIHNTLEPVAHLVPVCFGPQHKKFPEAIEFIRLGFGFEINNENDLISICKNIHEHRLNYQSSIKNWLTSHKGASEKIYNQIFS